MLATATDGALAAAALAGRQEAFAVLIARHRVAIYRLARAYANDDDEALDLVQEAFASAFASLRRYDGDRPFGAWLSRIAINKCHDWARRQRVRRMFRRARPIWDVAEPRDDAPDAHDVASGRERLARLERAIAALPANLKDVVILRTIEDLSQAETAATLGITGKAVETRLSRARGMLIAARRD